MATETITLIIAIASLVIAVATLIVAYKTYVSTEKAYKFAKDNSKGDIKKRLRVDEKRLEKLNEQIKKSTWGYADVTEDDFEERDRLEDEIEDLKDRL